MRRSLSLALIAPLAAAVFTAVPTAAAPWMWDQDENGIDDRLTEVFLNGINAAFEEADPDGRLRFEVSLVDDVLTYGGYVFFDHLPTSADSLALTGLGAQVITVFESVPYVRVRALYPSIVLIASQPSVLRVEAVSLMYPMNLRGGRELAVRRGKGAPRVTVETAAGLTGAGVVVAVLDTGINDTAQGSYPGHADLAGRVVGGAYYGGSGPSGYTAWSASVNPAQGTPGLTSYHGTHVAASIGGGSRDRTLGGMAPGARFADVKVLADDGLGHGLAEGLEWCIQNAARDWGGGAVGIDVINLSLSGTDASAGDDCVSALVDAAAAEGVAVVASAGNGGACGLLSAPGAADGAITVTAYDPLTGGLASFADEGPRPDDHDGTHADELKPDVAAPGVKTASAWGSPLSAGLSYATASGTSMSAALVSGVAALLLEADPALSPAALKTLLRDTSDHRFTSTSGCSQGTDPYSLDPRYHAGWGWGSVQVMAAYRELTRPDRTQFVDLAASWDDGSGEAVITWVTQREQDLTGFLVQRAPDAGGAPGAWSTVSAAVPAAGSASLASGNRTTYLETDASSPATDFWYRVTTVGGSSADVSDSVFLRTEDPIAKAHLSFTHNSPETDLVMAVGSGLSPAFPDWSIPVALHASLDSLYLGPLPGGTQQIRYQLSLPLYAAEGAGAYLPPTPFSPWWLTVTDGGFAERQGELEAFSLVVGGTPYVSDTPTPRPTVEGSASRLWIPEVASSGVPGGEAGRARDLASFPNPFRGGTSVLVRLPAAGAVSVTIHDVRGRLVRTLHAGRTTAGEHRFLWDGSGDRGEPLAAGRYYLRADRGPAGTRVAPVVLLH